MNRLVIYDADGVDISEEIRLKNGRSNPFGWSIADIYRERWISGAIIEEKIGSHYCGEITLESGYTHRITNEE